MGIRGLKNYLVKKLDGVVAPTALPPNATLVIDGDGWVFQLIETSHEFRPELGGCYSSFEESVSAEINRLRSCGLQLLVLFDGPEQRMKDRTKLCRAADREQEWAKFYDFCEEGVKHSATDSFPLPPLSKKQLVATLKNIGVSSKICKGEADQDIAKAVQSGNKGLNVGEEMFFAYGRDSDFYAMKDCPYLDFGTVTATECEEAFSSPMRMRATPTKASLLRQKPTHQAHARVWRRSEICEALGVSESQFLTWAMLVGNDYTGHFDRTTAFNLNLPSQLSNFSSTTLDALLEAVAATEEGFVLCASPELDAEQSAAVQLTVDYSRAIYELQDIDHFPLDAPFSLPGGEEEEERLQRGSGGFFDFTGYDTPDFDEDGYFSGVYAYASALVGSSGKVKLLGIAEHAVAYLRQRNASSNGLDENKHGDAGPVVTEEHLTALSIMLRQIYLRSEQVKAAGSPSASNKKLVADSAELISEEFPYRPRWADAVAAFVFQRACTAMLSLLPQDVFRNKNNAPRHMFNGALFHRVLMLERAKTASGVGAAAAYELAPITSPVAVAPVLPAPVAPVEDKVMSLADAMRMLTMKSAEDGASPSASPSTVESGGAVEDSASPVNLPPAEPVPAAPVQDILPIDAFREEILQRIHRDRVTIIHGETGCGKSSCLPRFLLEEAEDTGAPVQIMVSQPRRIAVTSLLRRLRTTLGDKVGMRMGHGIKDETKNTKIHYVTTGYLVRALAHQPERFQKCTHLIIDEVHERSVDGDLVCLLARDLLKTHPTIRIVLMSATIHTSLYRDYFASRNDGSFGDMDCLSVGVRRFPVDIKYAEDLTTFTETNASSLSTRERAFGAQVQNAAGDLVKMTKVYAEDVPQKLALAQYKAAVALVRAVGVEGTGILIFVSGINDITEIVQMLEPFPKYLVYPIHSDIPADEQELAFGVTPDDKVKVVVATNAAESSVTIPDCDVVICLGTHKSLQYSALNHRTQLVNTWISKASATQRAGRTGRVRPGSVYRLYSKNLFEGMSDHEVAEVHRRPLQDVLLSMWVMLEDAVGFSGVTPFLQGLIEAPDMRNIEQSYQYLYESDLVTHPSDEGYLTAMGRLSGELPVDIALGRMIAYGVMLGVAAEAVVLAAALSLPKAPFRYANAIYSEPDEFNAIVKAKFLTATEFDQGSYSEPIMLLRLLMKWRTLDSRKLGEFCAKRGLLQAVMRQFKSMAEHLCHTVSSRLQRFKTSANTRADDPASNTVDLASIGDLSDTKLNLLRMILLWSCSGNVLRMQGKNKKKLQDTSVLVHSNEVTETHMKEIFGSTVPYTYSNRGRRVYDARVTYWDGANYFHSLVQLLDNMAAVSELLAVQASWVVVKSNSEKATLVAFAYLHKHKDATESLLIEHVFGHESRLASGKAIAEAIVKEAHFMNGVTVCVCPDASKSELKRLNDFRDLIEVSLSALIPIIGNAKVTASNCVPSEVTLQEMFFGSAETDGEGAPQDRRIAVQVTHSRAVLSFPEDNEEDDATLNPPLIDDLPLGHRLISCCQQQVGKSRNKSLMLKAHDSLGHTPSKGVAVPGSIEYAHQQLQRQGQGQANTTAQEVRQVDLARKLEVKLGCISAAWINIRALKTTPSVNNSEEQHTLKSINAILPRQSMLSCSFHRGPEVLFAVTHSTLVLGAQGDLVACEGVSFLPPGPSWLYLALLCAGADASQVEVFCPDDKVDVTKGQTVRAGKVADLFRTATSIVPREDIEELIEDVFFGTAGPDGEGFCSSEGESSDGDEDALEEAWEEAELRMLLEMELEHDAKVVMQRSSAKKKAKKATAGGEKKAKAEKKGKVPAENAKGAAAATGGGKVRADKFGAASEVPLVVQQARRSKGLLTKAAPANGANNNHGNNPSSAKKQRKAKPSHFGDEGPSTDVTPMKAPKDGNGKEPKTGEKEKATAGTPTPKKTATAFKPSQVTLKKKTPVKKTLATL